MPIRRSIAATGTEDFEAACEKYGVPHVMKAGWRPTNSALSRELSSLTAPLARIDLAQCMPVSPSRLTLRRTRIPGAGDDDWSVILDGEEVIGRIYRAPNRVPAAWFWGLNSFPSSAANSGYAPSLEEAKARFRARWEALRSE